MNKELIEQKAQAIFRAEDVFTHRRLLAHVPSVQWLSQRDANDLLRIRMREELEGLNQEAIVAVLDRWEALSPQLDKTREMVAAQVEIFGY
jgi:hypothetical protein